MAASKEQAQLKVLVPNITSLRQFVNCSDPSRVRGFCIDVFERALSIVLPTSSSSPNMSIHYSCFNFSPAPANASPGPTYNSMVELVAKGEYDAVIGDVTIGAYRSSMVDFTHHYMESGVVILEKVAHDKAPPWLFFGWPFSLKMWCTIVGAFLFVGFLLFCFELGNNPEFTQGSIGQCTYKIAWFVIEALILLERDVVQSSLAQLVVVAWVFFVVLLSASYTAGLSSFLTASTLSTAAYDIISLKDSGQRLGYRRGSIVKDVLTTRFQIPLERLVPLRFVSEYVGNITKGPNSGGVLAIVDELPYVNIILANLSSTSCDFSISGPQLTQQGFGFVSLPYLTSYLLSMACKCLFFP
ncbi:hypothetical protein L7F22_032930 [Adiantum nelumboides]|nr:hypothetical protein [Adiantum nelumboides]